MASIYQVETVVNGPLLVVTSCITDGAREDGPVCCIP